MKVNITYWRQYIEDPIKIEKEELDELIQDSIEEWNECAEEGSEVTSNEIESIVSFTKMFWEQNNKVVDRDVIFAYIAQAI